MRHHAECPGCMTTEHVVASVSDQTLELTCINPDCANPLVVQVEGVTELIAPDGLPDGYEPAATLTLWGRREPDHLCLAAARVSARVHGACDPREVAKATIEAALGFPAVAAGQRMREALDEPDAVERIIGGA